MWGNENNLSLNVSKTKELISDFGKKREHAPTYINGTEVERVKSVKSLGVTITKDLSWTIHADAAVKKAQERLFFLSRLRKFGMSIRSLTNLYRCTIESTLSSKQLRLQIFYLKVWRRQNRVIKGKFELIFEKQECVGLQGEDWERHQ
eukprot:g38806.t1